MGFPLSPNGISLLLPGESSPIVLGELDSGTLRYTVTLALSQFFFCAYQYKDVNDRACKITEPGLFSPKTYFPAIKSAKVVNVCTAAKFASLKDGKLTITCPEGSKPKYSTEIPRNYSKNVYPYPLVNPQT
jgi:hypothetical protein